ncbi:hypothetical protein BHE74_00055979, partial [Ensete ventricosum]
VKNQFLSVLEVLVSKTTLWAIQPPDIVREIVFWEVQPLDSLGDYVWAVQLLRLGGSIV